MPSLKSALIHGAMLPGLRSCWQWLARDRVAIFMLHRFAEPSLDVSGHDAEAVRADLEYLRAAGYRFVELDETLAAMKEGRPLPPNAVAFTIDDGYFDQASIAAPLFADYDCPVTTFVCTGFLDGELWMWWDKIEYVFERTEASRLAFEIGGAHRELAWTTPSERATAEHALVETCKRVDDAEKHAAIERLAEAAGVSLPEDPPDRYRPMTWDALRQAEGLGMRFGPHTLTHPILSMTGDAQSRREIEASRDRLDAETSNASRVFCYPNGQDGDFGPREYATLEELGFLGSVTGQPGYASRLDLTGGPPRPQQIRRFSHPLDRMDLVQYASGFEHLKTVVRGGDR